MLELAPTIAYDTMLASHLPPVTQANKLQTPTQIMVGEKSPTSIHEVAKQLDGVIPNSTLSILERQDHMPDPRMVLQILASFFK